MSACYVPHIPKTYVDHAGKYNAAERARINEWIDRTNVKFKSVEFTGSGNGNTYRNAAMTHCRHFLNNSPYPFLHHGCKRFKSRQQGQEERHTDQ